VYRTLATLFVVLILGVPAATLAAVGGVLPAGLPWRVGFALVAPFAYAVLYVLVAGLLSVPFHGSIRPGKFPRDLTNPAYRARRLYGLCWTSVYYFTPLYWVALSHPFLKWMTFRLFGYRGQLDFTVYPDTWIRDLPLLDFGPGAYVSNKATLGTNVATSTGLLLVDEVKIGKGALVGHLAMVSTGCVLEEGAEVGVGCTVGSKVRVGKGAYVSPCTAVGHYVELGEGCETGYQSWIDLRAKIGPGVKLPARAVVPYRARIATQADADRHLSATDGDLVALARHLAAVAPPAADPAATPRPATARVRADHASFE
jgi:acetyltransferase-like isoleucine patch superfamily enzyme